jgi:hypothetical protein
LKKKSNKRKLTHDLNGSMVLSILGGLPGSSLHFMYRLLKRSLSPGSLIVSVRNLYSKVFSSILSNTFSVRFNCRILFYLKIKIKFLCSLN